MFHVLFDLSNCMLRGQIARNVTPRDTLIGFSSTEPICVPVAEKRDETVLITVKHIERCKYIIQSLMPLPT